MRTKAEAKVPSGEKRACVVLQRRDRDGARHPVTSARSPRKYVMRTPIGLTIAHTDPDACAMAKDRGQPPCGPRRHPAARRGPGRTCPRDWRQKRSFRSVQTAWKKSFQEIVCGGWPPACSKPRRGSGWGKEATICQRSSLSSGHATCVSDLGNLLFELRGTLAVKLGDGLTVAARRGHGDSPPSAIHFSSRQSAPSTILDRGALMPDCDYRPQV